MTAPHHDPHRGPSLHEDGASRRARLHAPLGPHASAPDWHRAALHDASEEERWGSGSAWELDDVANGDPDDEIDPLPIRPLPPPKDADPGRRRTP